MITAPIFTPCQTHDLVSREPSFRAAANFVGRTFRPAPDRLEENISSRNRDELDLAPGLESKIVADSLGNGHLALAGHLGHRYYLEFFK